MAERQIRIAAKLYELRGWVRDHFGDAWPAILAEQGPLLQAIAATRGQGVLDTATDLAAEAPLNARLTILAVAVELIEPSPAPAPSTPSPEPARV